MKTKDILEGSAYAWRHSKYGATLRVVILETGVQVVAGHVRYGASVYRPVTNKGGVRVRFDDGGVRVVPTREIVEHWSNHEARETAIAERRKRELDARAKEQEANGRVITALENAGVKSARAAGMGIVIPAESHEAVIELVNDALEYRARQWKAFKESNPAVV